MLAGETVTFFDGSRSIGGDSTTVLTLSLSPLEVDPIYRFTWTSGTAPGFRTARSVDLSGQSVSIQLNANQTVTVTGPAGSFASAQVADEVLVPGVLTGDASGPFSEANVGFWVVLAKTSSTLQLARRATASFSGVTETVAVVTTGQLQVFAPGPVQVGDYVDVLASFSAPVRRSYQVTEVSPAWFEVVASDPLPSLEVGTAAAPPIFYSNAWKVAWLQVDQEATYSLNGGAAQRLAPLVPGSTAGDFWTTGPVWSLSVTNRSAQILNASLRGAS